MSKEGLTPHEIEVLPPDMRALQIINPATSVGRARLTLLNNLVLNDNHYGHNADWISYPLGFTEEEAYRSRPDFEEVNEMRKAPFYSGAQEVKEQIERTKNVPNSVGKLLHIVRDNITPFIEPDLLDETVEIFSPLARDTVRLARWTRQIDRTLEKDSRWIFDPSQLYLYKYIGEEASRALTYSRNLGLIPFDDLDTLKSLNIRVLGASVAMASIDLAAALGANLDFYDKGKNAPSTIPRLSYGGIRDLPKYKAEVLQRELQHKYPYGRFRGYIGEVVPSREYISGPQDVTYEDFLRGADAWEVIDKPHIKADIRRYMAENDIDIPIFMAADVSSNPYAAIEFPAHENFFNQGLSMDELKKLSIPATSGVENIDKVYKMVENNIGGDHRAQLLLARFGLVGFWSQTPISSRESAAAMNKLMISYIQGKEVDNRVVHPRQSPTKLFPYTDRQEYLLRTVWRNILASRN